MPRDCYFLPSWLQDKEFSAWLKRVDSDRTMAYCKFCDCSFSIRNRGLGQLRSHAEKDKHCAQVKMMKSQVVFTSRSSASGSGVQEVQLSLPVKLWSLSHEEKTRRAETLWAMKVASEGFSYQSSSGTSTLFKLMFPDSDIAADFTLDADKCSYLIAFGLGPYFHYQTVKSLKSSGNCFCLEIDETATFSGYKQLDKHLRFWDECLNMVVVHYYKSNLLGHAEASVVQKAILDAFTDVGLLNIGTCNLHVLHNAFGSGMGKLSHWALDTFLKDIFSWMKSSSVRKSDFLQIESEYSTDSESHSKLPLYYAKLFLQLLEHLS